MGMCVFFSLKKNKTASEVVLTRGHTTEPLALILFFISLFLSLFLSPSLFFSFPLFLFFFSPRLSLSLSLSLYFSPSLDFSHPMFITGSSSTHLSMRPPFSISLSLSLFLLFDLSPSFSCSSPRTITITIVVIGNSIWSVVLNAADGSDSSFLRSHCGLVRSFESAPNGISSARMAPIECAELAEDSSIRRRAPPCV